MLCCTLYGQSVCGALIVPFPLISTVQAVNWQSRKADFIKNVKYFLWKTWREKKNGPSLFFLLLSLIFHRDLAKLQNLGAFQNWKSQKYFEIETPHQENWKTVGGEKNPRKTTVFTATKSISVYQNTQKLGCKTCPDLREGWTICHNYQVLLFRAALSLWPRAEQLRLFAATQELNISAWSFPWGLFFVKKKKKKHQQIGSEAI